MNRIASKIAIEVLVGLKERYRNAASRQQQRQHRSTRTAADDTARGLAGIEDSFLGTRRRGWAGWLSVHLPAASLQVYRRSQPADEIDFSPMEIPPRRSS